MDKLGECLVFFLRYPVEMQKLEQDTELEGLENPEETKKMADHVSNKALEDAAEFLSACGIRMKAWFSKIGRPAIEKEEFLEKNKIQKSSSVSIGIWPSGKNRPSGGNWKMKAGVDLIIEPGRLELVPWLWRIGEDAEKTLRFALQSSELEPSNDFSGWESGKVALARLPLSPPSEGFDLFCGDMLDAVENAFKMVSRDQLDHSYPS